MLICRNRAALYLYLDTVSVDVHRLGYEATLSKIFADIELIVGRNLPEGDDGRLTMK
jgi:hypothetical protein